MIHELIENGIMNNPERKLDGKLWVSDLGYNPYNTMRRLVLGEMKDFDYTTRLKMQNGVALEVDSLALIAQNSTVPIRTQVPLFNDIWSGYADVVFDFGGKSPVIYDHKGSGGRWWDYKGSLPRVSDCCQVWLYGELYYGMYNVRPKTGLYYRGWGTWAEFDVTFDGLGFTAVGTITDEKGNNPAQVRRGHQVNPVNLRAELESLYYLVQEKGIAVLESMTEPDGEDWDYAVNNYDRLAKEYGGNDV